MSEMIKTPGGRDVNFIPNRAVAVVKSDTTVLPEGILYVGTGGDVVVMPSGNTATVTFVTVPDGSFLPIYITMVYSAGTDTADMLMVY